MDKIYLILKCDTMFFLKNNHYILLKYFLVYLIINDLIKNIQTNNHFQYFKIITIITLISTI